MAIKVLQIIGLPNGSGKYVSGLPRQPETARPTASFILHLEKYFSSVGLRVLLVLLTQHRDGSADLRSGSYEPAPSEAGEMFRIAS